MKVNAKKYTAALLIEKDRFDLYHPALSGILRYTYPLQIIRDLEVINPELLKNQINLLIQQNKIPPANLIILLGDSLLFEKRIPNARDTNIQSEMEKFLENVPFENITAKTYQFPKESLIIAVNRDFYDKINIGFEVKEFQVTGVIPAFAFAPGINLAGGLDSNLGKHLVKKYDSIKKLSLSEENEVRHETAEQKLEISENEDQKKQLEKRKIFIVVGVFAVLLGILAYVYIQSNATSAKLVSSKTVFPPISVKPTPTTPVVIENPTSSPSAQIDKKTISIQIFYDTKRAADSTLLQNLLIRDSYTNIELKKSDTIATSATLIVFSSKVPAAIQDEVTKEVIKLFPDAKSQVNTDVTGDVIITLSK